MTRSDPLSWRYGSIVAALFRRAIDQPAVCPALDAHAAAFLATQRLGPIAWHHLREEAPPEAATLLAAADLDAQAKAERAVQTLKALAGTVPPFLVAKGIPASRWLYGRDHARSSGDVDILVRRADFPNIRRALDSLGFRSERVFPAGIAEPFFPPPGLAPVDVHWSPWSSQRKLGRLFADASVETVSGVAIRVPSPADHAALLADHYLHDLGSRLINLLDLAVAARRLNGWKALGRRSGLIRRELARWTGLESPAPESLPAWRFLDSYWTTRPPSERTRFPGSDPRSFLVSLRVACQMRPSQTLGILRTAIWPKAPSHRFRGRRWWGLRRLALLLGL